MDYFLRSYLRRHLMGRPVLSLQMIGCFFKLAFDMLSTFYRLKSQNYRFSTDLQMREKINFSLLVFTFGWARYNAYCPRNFLILSQVPCHILWIHLCSCHAFSQALFLPAPTETRWSELINIIQSWQNNTLGARDFSSAVSVFCQVFMCFIVTTASSFTSANAVETELSFSPNSLSLSLEKSFLTNV